MTHDPSNAESVRIAVTQRDEQAVRVAVAARRGMEERDESGNTPFLVAIATAQFVIADIILDGGADAWAHDEFGLTAAHRLLAVPFATGTPDGDARARLIEKLRARGLPFPPPPPAEILTLDAAGRWGPRSAGGR